MSNKDALRPVEVNRNGKKIKGHFHRFVYSSYNYCSITQALVELEDGRLKYFDPFFVRFTDRKNSISSDAKQNKTDSQTSG